MPYIWECLGGLSNRKCTAEKSSSGGISGAIVELLGAESRLGLLVEGREQRLDDKRESQMGERMGCRTLFL